MPDYLIVDSQGLMDRPSLSTFLRRPRERTAMLLMATGTVLSVSNLDGNYINFYLALVTMSIVSLGPLSTTVGVHFGIPGVVPLLIR